MRQASTGFIDITWRDITDNVPSVKRLYVLAMAMYPASVVMRTMRLRNPAQHSNLRGAMNVGRRQQQHGLCRESIMAAQSLATLT